MQPLKVAIITPKLGTYDASSSTSISDHAVKRGHKVFEFEAHHLRYEEGKLLADALEYPKKKKVNIDLRKMDVILFRPNPPVDMAYLTTLFLLRTIENEVLVLNRPSSVIELPEKIFPLYLKEFMPPTLISSNSAKIKEFAAKHKEIVVKPLYDFGGNGITRLKKGGSLKLNSTIPVVAQKFIKEVTKGDKRILFINYKFHSVFNRIPPSSSFIANIAQGGKLTASRLTKREELICKKLQPLLKKYDLPICGIDVINGFITEINITSPTGFNWAKDLYNMEPETELWEKIEQRIKLKKAGN